MWQCGPHPLFPSCILCGSCNTIYTAEASGNMQIKDCRRLLCLKMSYLQHKYIPLKTQGYVPFPRQFAALWSVATLKTLEAEDNELQDHYTWRQPCSPSWPRPANYLMSWTTRTVNPNLQFFLPPPAMSSPAKENNLLHIIRRKRNHNPCFSKGPAKRGDVSPLKQNQPMWVRSFRAVAKQTS